MTVTHADSHMPPEDSGGSPVPLLPQPESRQSPPVIHPSADAPLCPSCRQLDLPFFDPSCPGCLEILHGPQTTVGQVFAILRQWVPQTQRNVELLVAEILRRGANVNDRDGLTDMTLLHYACKAGACGVGDIAAATRTVAALLDSGADPSLRCRWTDMAAAHYAAYFDVPSVLELLHRATREVDSPCRDFENGSPLHIAATNLCTEAARYLVEHGANTGLRDDLGRTPLECVPDPGRASPELREAIQAMRDLLSRHMAPASPVTGKAVLGAMGLHLGDRVRVAGVKVGVLRYLGATQFASGIWAGVELDEPQGKNDGSINGVQYFTCPPNHGIFAPFNKIAKFDGSPIKSPSKPAVFRHVSYPKIDVSHVTSKIETGLHGSKQLILTPVPDLNVGDRVQVAGRRFGTIRFSGETKFAPGWWYGVELDKPHGKHNGTLQGVTYFSCPPNHGIFAVPSKLAKAVEGEDHSSDQDSADMSFSRSSTEGEMSQSMTSSMISRKSSASRMLHSKMGSISNLDGSKRCWLTVGVNVFVNNEIGVVRYVGPVEFAEGTWLGIELRSSKGRNDGCVQGHRYFTCRPNHGLLVRPSRVTVRGINGAKLMPC